MKKINNLIRKHTCFNGVLDLLKSEGNYRPTLYTKAARRKKDREELTAIADFYDAIMAKRNDPRRAYRV